MSEQDQKRVKARRRMRGIAVFFMVISMLGVAGNTILHFSGHRQLDVEGGYEFIFFVGGLFIGALAVWNGSRLVAVFMILLLSLSPILGLLGYIEFQITDFIRSMVYLVLAFIMTVSAFRYHSLSKLTSELLGGSRIIRWVGKSLMTLLIIVLSFGVGMIFFAHSNVVAHGKDIPEKHLDWLIEHSFLTTSEKPLFFYVDGAFSIEHGGSLLTDQYAGGWWQENGDLNSAWFKLGQICRVEMVSEGSVLEDAIYTIHGPGEENWVQLWLSIEEGIHKRFIARLKAINSRRMRPEIQAFCDEDRPIDWVEIAAANGISDQIVGLEAISQEQIEWLREQEYLFDGEQLLKFYSSGKYSISEGGSLLTDKYVGTWHEEGDKLNAWWGKIDQICKVSKVSLGDESMNPRYRFDILNDQWIELSLPGGEAQSEAFIRQVLALNEEQMTDDNRNACKKDSDTSVIE